MSEQVLPQNSVPNEPTLKDFADLVKKDIFLTLNCHHIGTVQSFDPVRQLCSATINYRKVYYESDGEGNFVPIAVEYPILLDCPAVVLGGGGAALTFPIAKGDECVILFNDRSLDNWLQGSSTSNPASPRAHSFADGLILVGVRSHNNVLPGYSTTAAELRTKDGTRKVSVDSDITVNTPGLAVTFKAAGGMSVVNAIGRFDFADNADVTFNTGTVIGLFGSGGKVKFQNAVGELIAALYNISLAVQGGTAGGFPLVFPASFATNLATILSFKV